MNKCLNCNKEIEGRGKTCSTRCRMAISRNKSVTESVTEPVTVTEKSVTEPQSVKEDVTVSKSVTKDIDYPTEYGSPERKLQEQQHPEWFEKRLGYKELLTKPGTPSSALCSHFLLRTECSRCNK